MKYLLLSIWLYCLFNSSFTYSVENSHADTSKPIHVVFLSPEPKGTEFWELMLEVMQASVEDLNIKLELEQFIATEFPYENVFDRLEEIVQQEHKPDYIISYLYLGVESQILDIIEKK